MRHGAYTERDAGSANCLSACVSSILEEVGHGDRRGRHHPQSPTPTPTVFPHPRVGGGWGGVVTRQRTRHPYLPTGPGTSPAAVYPYLPTPTPPVLPYPTPLLTRTLVCFRHFDGIGLLHCAHAKGM